jgi:hypothetical protein
MSKKWKTEDFDTYVEVVPLDDTKEHFAGDECWCDPKTTQDDNARPVISHNSADGREKYEATTH